VYFPPDEYATRWDKAYVAMRKAGFETAVVFQKTGGSYDRAGHGLWLTNYAALASGQEPQFHALEGGRSFAAVLLHEGRQPELLINEPIEVTDLDEIATDQVTYAPHLFLGVAERVVKLGCERVAYVGDDLLPAVHFRELLAATPSVEWVPADTLLDDAQRVKSERELDAYREAGDISSRALTAMTEALIRGERGSDAAALAADVIVRAGGGFQRLAINHGRHSERVFWRDSFYGFDTTAPQQGDLVRSWVYGPIFEGLWIDPGRTAVCGNAPTSAQRELIEGCLQVVDAVIDATRVGVTAREVGLVVDAVADSIGYHDTDAGSLWGLYGHGLGYFWAPPIVPAKLPGGIPLPDAYQFDRPYEAGMVLTSEAFYALPGVGTATFEQVFVLHEDGVELLTTTPKVFW
jgi:Xaa-Pro dipeptidase